MTPPEPGSAEALTAQTAWLRALARRLVDDAEAAEDAVQETLAVAVERPPRGGVPGRGWLATVLRNALRQLGRGEGRRRAREAAVAARRGSGPPAAAVAERLDVAQGVLEAVRSLEEPYRTAIVLRFLEGLPPREVARRSGVPTKTVHTRIDRGLARLRQRLDRRSAGGRESWLSALAPMAWPSGALSAGLGAIAMGAKWKLGAAAAAVALVGFTVVRLVPLAERGDPPSPRDALPALEPPDAPEELLGASTEQVRTAVAPEDGLADSALEPEAAPPETFLGRVVDVERRAVEGVLVQFRPTSRDWPLDGTERSDFLLRVDDPPAVSDADGEFRLLQPTERGELVARDPRWASVIRPGVHDEPPPAPPVVVVAPRRDYGGIVVDDAGLPLTGVLVEARLPPDLPVLAELGGQFASHVPMVGEITDDDGTFHLDGVGWLEGVFVSARLDGYERASEPLPEAWTDGLELVLRVLRPGAQVLVGQVLGPAGDPVEGALVGLGMQSTRSDGEGAFALSIHEGQPREGTLRAVAAGRLPARREIAEEDFERGEPIVLVLGGDALAIAGQVVGADGAALAGAQVWTFDGEHFGGLAQRMGNVEFLVGADVEEIVSREIEDRPSGREDESDDGGRFELTGLLDRTYTVFAMHPETLELARADHVQAGRDGLVLRLPGSERAVPVAGHVTTLGGTPIEGALIRAGRDVRTPETGNHRRGRSHRSAPMDFHAVSGPDGSFRFEALCVEGTSLLLNGTDIPIAQRRELAGESDLSDVRFAVAAACWMRLELEDPEYANGFEVLDAEGANIPLVFKAGDLTLSTHAASIQRGLSGKVRVDERAKTLVLYDDEGEVTRLPLSLVPGEVNVVRH